jgi:hypothetical protein
MKGPWPLMVLEIYLWKSEFIYKKDLLGLSLL